VLFRDTVRQFADESVRPHVKKMDEEGVFEHSLIDQFFQLGSWASRFRRSTAAPRARFFEAILAVEELSRVDPSAGVLVDVQNTLVNNALLRWTTARTEEALPAAHVQADTVRRVALSEAARARMPLRCRRAPTD
jgi:short-chain 2-methylacyl-CoA dehydrogenase